MKLRLPAKLPHLNAALSKTAHPDPRKGLCFHRTVGFVLDVPQAHLCVGTLRGATSEEMVRTPEASPVPFLHCWAEIGGNVYAPTTIEASGGRLRPFSREAYYAGNGVHNVITMSRKQLKDLSEEFGLAEHLLYDRPVRGGKGFAVVILDALTVRHAVGETGGIVPGE